MKPTVVLSNVAFVVALVVAIVASVGCSALLAKPAPVRVDRGSYPECGIPPGALATDILLGVVGGAFLVSAIDEGEGAPIAVGAALSSLYLGSAIYGFVVQNRCQDARVAAAASLSTKPLRAQLASEVPAASAPVLPQAALPASPSAPLPVAPVAPAAPLPSIQSPPQ